MPGQLWVCPHCNHLNDKGFLRSTYERRIGDGDTLNSKEYCGSCFESSSSHDVFSGALDASPEAEANPAPARLSFSSEPSPLTMSFSIDAMNTQRRRELPAAQGNDPFPDVAAEPPVSETLLAPVVVTEAGKAPALAELQALTPEEYFCYRCHRPLKIRSDAIISMHCPKCRFEVFVLRALVPPEEEVEALSPEEMEAYFTALPDFLIATRSGKFDEATRAARDMVSLLEESPVLWFNLGVVAALQAIRTGFADEHFPVALSALEQALTLGTSDRPVVLQALHALGTMEFTLKSFIAKVPDVLRQNYRFVDRRDIVKRLQGICDDISLIEKALSPSQRDLISLDPLKTFLLNFLASRPINVPSEVWCPMCTLKVRLDTLDDDEHCCPQCGGTIFVLPMYVVVPSPAVGPDETEAFSLLSEQFSSAWESGNIEEGNFALDLLTQMDPINTRLLLNRAIFAFYRAMARHMQGEELNDVLHFLNLADRCDVDSELVQYTACDIGIALAFHATEVFLHLDEYIAENPAFCPNMEGYWREYVYQIQLGFNLSNSPDVLKIAISALDVFNKILKELEDPIVFPEDVKAMKKEISRTLDEFILINP